MSEPSKSHPSLLKAYVLLAVGFTFGAHHIYLRSPFRALVSICLTILCFYWIGDFAAPLARSIVTGSPLPRETAKAAERSETKRSARETARKPERFEQLQKRLRFGLQAMGVVFLLDAALLPLQVRRARRKRAAADAKVASPPPLSVGNEVDIKRRTI